MVFLIFKVLPMLTKIYKFLNENHWYVILVVVSMALCFYFYGCQSTVPSLLDPVKRVNRDELQAEAVWLATQIDIRSADLDRQDEIRQQLLDAATLIGSEGGINPSGIVSLVATIGAVSFGLDRNRKFKNAVKDNTAEPTT